MNIYFVNFLCGYFGGVEQYIADTAKGLMQLGHKVFLIYSEVGKNSAEYINIFAQSWELDFEQPATKVEHFFMGLSEGINSPDVLFFHKIPSARNFGKILSRFPSVRMLHDHDICCPRRHKYYALSGKICNHKADFRCYLDGAFLEPDHESKLKVRFRSIKSHQIEKNRNKSFSSLLVGSRWMKDELLQNGFKEERIEISPPVINMSFPDNIPSPNGNQLLYVGQLIKGKGVDLLLKALTLVKHPWTLKVVGEGNSREKLEKLSNNLGLSGRVEFCGWVPREQIGTLYEASLLTLVPSRWPEPFGMVGLEAMGYERPVIGFAVGGIPDWLSHEQTGFLAQEQNIEELAKHIQRLLSDKKLAQKMGKAGKKRLKDEFNLKKNLSGLERIFMRAIKARQK